MTMRSTESGSAGAEPSEFCEGAPFGAGVAKAPCARLEKFQVPLAARITLICGDSIWRVPTSTWCEKMSGASETPMRICDAVRNGAEPKLGSSAMLRSLASRLPEKGARLRLPNFTLRPSAAVSCFSMAGRKVSAFIRKGVSATTKTTSPASASSIFVQRFTEGLGATGQERDQDIKARVYDGPGNDS